MRKKVGSKVGMLGGLLSVVLLSGCVTVQTGYSPLDNEGKRDYLAYAASESPVYLKTLNWPLAGGDAAASEAAAGYASGAVFGSPARFTPDPGQAKHPDYYVVLAVNLPRGSNATVVCSEDPVPTDRSAERFSLTAGFCSGGVALSTSVARGPDPQSTGDEQFRRMVRGAIGALFPIEKERDRDREVFRIGG